MPSLPQLRTSGAGAGAMPFAGYAQILRMLMPPVYRVGFYDPKGRALWVNDGIEEPEFRMHLDLVLARFAASRPDERAGPYGATDQLEPFFVFPIRDSRQTLLGALTLICRELPATAAYRRIEHIEHLLAPFIEILRHAWQEATNIPQTMPEQKPASPIAPNETSDSTTPLPALLRRTLALATRSLQGAFGAVIAAERPFTLNHRVSPDESDLAINAAIDNVRGTILKYLQARQEPVLSNAAGSGRTQQLPYKLLAMPLKADPSTLAAALIVFREKNAPDFSKNDLASIAQIAAQVPAATLKELVLPAKPSIANVPELVAQVGDKAIENSTASLDSAPRAYRPQAVPTVKSPPLLQPEPTRSAPQPPPKVVRFAGMRSDMPMDERIRIALRQDAFDLYVQKIAPLRDTQRAERYEVLLRMNDGNTLYTPQAFFAAAEASELMPELDQWVIRELMSTLRKRAAVLRTTCWEFSVNIAAQTLLTDQFSEYVLQELKRSSIPAGLLVFEVAESDAIEHQYSLSILAQRLHGVGCRIALDNCRGGLRTFDTVRKWPVSCLKIDGSLIRHVVSNCRYESQVRAVAKMASEMGIETVAECVETETTRERLLSMEIDYAQGHHFGRPEPLGSLFAR